MGRKRGIPGCSGEVLAISEGNMVAIVAHVALCQPKVNDVDLILVALGGSYQKVVRLDISV